MSDEPLEVELTILPGSSAPEPPPTRRLLHRRARPRVLVALGVVVGLGAAGLVLLRDDGPDPAAILRDARRAVADVHSFEFSLTARDSQSAGGEQISTDVTERFVANGKWAEDRWWVRSTTNSVVAEVLVDGDTTYSREVDLVSGSIREEPWITSDTESPAENLLESLADTGSRDVARLGPDDATVFVDAGGPDEERVRAAVAVYLGVRAGGPRTRNLALSDKGFDRSPRGFLEVVENMTASFVSERPDGAVMVTGRLTAARQFDVAFGAPLPAALVELHLDAERVPTRLRLVTSEGHSAFSVDVEFRDWSEPVAIAVPMPDEVDATPVVDEEHLRVAAESIELVWPATVPAGWEMAYLAVLPAAPSGSFLPQGVSRLCDVIQIEWVEPVPEEAEVEEIAGFLRIGLTPLSCALAFDPSPFGEFGGPGGLPTRPTAIADFEAQVGNTAVTVESWTLDPMQVYEVLNSFTRVDIDTVIATAVATAAGD